MAADREGEEAALLSRRALLRGGCAAALLAAGSLAGGCATLPHASPASAAPTAHRCEHRHCRYYRRVAGAGRCCLAARVAGGTP